MLPPDFNLHAEFSSLACPRCAHVDLGQIS